MLPHLLLTFYRRMLLIFLLKHRISFETYSKENNQLLEVSFTLQFYYVNNYSKQRLLCFSCLKEVIQKYLK